MDRAIGWAYNPLCYYLVKHSVVERGGRHQCSVGEGKAFDDTEHQHRHHARYVNQLVHVMFGVLQGLVNIAGCLIALGCTDDLQRNNNKNKYQER